MAASQITGDDIAQWSSLSDIAASFESHGLERRDDLGADNELVLQLADRELLTLVEAEDGQQASDYKPDNHRCRTNLVVTDDYSTFTFYTRVQNWEGQRHGRIKHQKLSFTKQQMTSDDDKNTVLRKLNRIRYGEMDAVTDFLYETRQVVEQFYEEFEQLRTDLVRTVDGIPDDRGDIRRRYVQIVLNRLIFLYFVQEKGLLNRDTDYLRKKHDQYAADGDVYESFYRPLFFDVLAQEDHDPQFGSLPYLNGGLFSPSPMEAAFDEARLGANAEETNAQFDRILSFLSEWNWNIDKRLDVADPKNLSPAILGHIFERTVNQKEMGAYHTPEEITGFMTRRTIHPCLLDQLNDAVDADYDTVDEVFGFDEATADSESDASAVADGGVVTTPVNTDGVQIDHVETLYHEVLTEIRVLDPAVGSGVFLLAAQDVLLDIYVQCLELFRRLNREGRGGELQNKTRELLERIETRCGAISLYAKREIVIKNLYGVDTDNSAVEICKLRLWLSMIVDIEDDPRAVDTLPNIDFNVRQGNSLIGRIDHIEPERPDDGDHTDTENSALSDYEAGGWQDEITETIREYKQAESSDAAVEARSEAEELIDRWRPEYDENLLRDCHEDGFEEFSLSELREFDPFHWTLEFPAVYDGGFDVVIGNPPWDRLKPLRDDYFTKYDGAFRMRDPSDKDAKQSELLDDPEIRRGWEQYRAEVKRQRDFINKYNNYKNQTATIGGRTYETENDLSALFLERVFSLVRDDGYASQILPGSIFTGSSTKQLRGRLLQGTSVDSLVTFENNDIFPDIDSRYNFGIVTFRNGGETETLEVSFQQQDLSILPTFDSDALRIPRQVVDRYSPEARTFPMIDDRRQITALETILQHEPVVESVDGSWRAEPYRELDRTRDSDQLSESEGEHTYPVLGGSNVYQYEYDPTHFDIEPPQFWSLPEAEAPDQSAKRRIREKNRRQLKSALAEQLEGQNSFEADAAFLDRRLKEERGEGLTAEDVQLDCKEYRIVYRDVARATDERTMIASVIPPGWVCHNTLHTVRPYEIDVEPEDLSEQPLERVYERVFTDRELFAAVGLLNSVPFDFLMRTKVDTHILMYKFEESQVPHLTPGDEWFESIWRPAARLNCYGDDFAEMRDRLGGLNPETDPDERTQLRAEIDAAAFHAYGFDQETVEYVLRNFGTVQNPRVMTDEQFHRIARSFQAREDR